MTSVPTPAVVASLLIALAISVVPLRSVVAQTPAGQTPTSPTPAPQPPATPPPAQPAAPQPPATPPPDAPVPVVPPAGQPVGAPGTVPPIGTDTDHGTALLLLDRIAAVLDAAVNRKASKSDVVGTTGSDDDGPMKVVIERAALDEMRAELTQIRLLLKNENR